MIAGVEIVGTAVPAPVGLADVTGQFLSPAHDVIAAVIECVYRNVAGDELVPAGRHDHVPQERGKGH